MELSGSSSRPASPANSRGTSTAPPSWVVILLGLLVVCGGWLRLHDLDGRTIRQGEIFVPGIALPAGVSDPHAMLTVGSTLSGLMWDVHPPTWFLGMLFWTKAFGTSLFGIRLPSVLFGTLAILLTYWVAALATDRITALLSAAFLAFNGHHLLWSQVARPYAMTCCVGLGATAFLVLALRSGPRQAIWGWLYALTTLLGLVTLYYFWPLFLTQFGWACVQARRPGTSASRLVRMQLLLLILAAPILTLAMFQSRPSYLEEGGITFLSDFLRFGFLFEPDEGVVRPFSDTLNFVFLVGSLLLLGIGLFRLMRTTVDHPSPTGHPGLSLRFLSVATAVSCGVTASALVVFDRAAHYKTPGLLPTIAIPLVVLAAAAMLSRARRLLAGLFRAIGNRFQFDIGSSLIASLAIAPAAIVALISVAVPFFASKGMLLFVPYLLIVLAAGLTSVARMGRLGRASAVAMVLVLAVVHIASVRYQGQRPGSPKDYRGLASVWQPQLRDRDVIFAMRHWATTPVFYYLDVNRYQFAGQDFTASAKQSRTGRVWVLLPEGTPLPDEMALALQGFARQLVLRAPQLQVALFTRLDP